MKDALACVRAICFDRLREMFDITEPFPAARRKLDGIFGPCHTCLPNRQSYSKQKRNYGWFGMCDTLWVRDGECRKKWHLKNPNFTPHETVRHTSNSLSEYSCLDLPSKIEEMTQIKKKVLCYLTLRCFCSDETLAGFNSFWSLFNFSKHCWPWTEVTPCLFTSHQEDNICINNKIQKNKITQKRSSTIVCISLTTWDICPCIEISHSVYV